jgi:hypothetical protein
LQLTQFDEFKQVSQIGSSHKKQLLALTHPYGHTEEQFLQSGRN